MTDADRKRLRKIMLDAAAPLKQAVRKSSKGPIKIVKKDDGQKPSIAKYLRGSLWGNWDDAELEKSMFSEVAKVLNGVVATAGGFLIHPDFVPEIIEVLRAKSIIRSMGATVYTINSDTLQIPRQATASTGTWLGYTEGKTESELTLAEFKLVLKECAAITKIKNALLEDASAAVDTIVRTDLASALAIAEDIAFINGAGGVVPLGILNDPLVGSTILGAGAGAVPTFDDLMDAMYQIELNNGTYTGWVAHPRTKNTLRKIKDANGQYIYHLGGLRRDLTGQPPPDELLGLPIKYTTNVPINRTAGVNTNCSAIILANWPMFGIAQKPNYLKIDASTEAETSFRYNETWFRGSIRVDGGVKQPNEFRIIDGVLP